MEQANPNVSHILEALNEAQRAAVEYCEGNQLVIAGAGSGKTRVLTYKIAYLLQIGFRPWSILALTFTNKAAGEMKERIGQLVGRDVASRIVMGTFHSVFARILRSEAGHIGYKQNYTIYDENDSRSLLSTIIREMGLDDKVYKPATVHARISMAKNHLIAAEAYGSTRELVEKDNNDRMPALSAIYTVYSERCRIANAMDFDDLLLNTFLLFHTCPEVLEKYARAFAYVLVDEYQDTNYAQQCIVDQLTSINQRLCVVGDDAQSIYAFRGANIDKMLDFNSLHADCRIFKLEQNYRSTQNIVAAANSLISNNRRQIKKDVFSENGDGEKVQLKEAYSDREEAVIVCKEIRRLRRAEGLDYRDFCILYRTNAQSRAFEEELRKQDLPYRIYGGLSFYQRKEIKDIVAYFRLVANPDDDEALRRIINYPTRGIGNTTVAKLTASAAAAGVSIWTVANAPLQYGLSLSKLTAQKVAAFCAMMSSFMADKQTLDACELGQRIMEESGYMLDIYAENTPEGLARQQNVGEFQSVLSDFVDSKREEGKTDEAFLEQFIQETALLTDADTPDEDNPQGRVALMTVHASKGLEFTTVFIVGLEENIFPSIRSCNSLRELEEERRLLYVAITRAERHCILTYANNRYMYGKMSFNNPSRFIGEISRKFMSTDDDVQGLSRLGGSDTVRRPFASMQRTAGSPFMPNRSSAPQTARPQATWQRPAPSVEGRPMRRVVASSSPSAAPSIAGALREGSTIEHQRFGIGLVTRIEGTGENTKATVDFRNLGTKQLLLKFAKYKIIS